MSHQKNNCCQIPDVQPRIAPEKDCCKKKALPAEPDIDIFIRLAIGRDDYHFDRIILR